MKRFVFDPSLYINGLKPSKTTYASCLFEIIFSSEYSFKKCKICTSQKRGNKPLCLRTSGTQ